MQIVLPPYLQRWQCQEHAIEMIHRHRWADSTDVQLREPSQQLRMHLPRPTTGVRSPSAEAAIEVAVSHSDACINGCMHTVLGMRRHNMQAPITRHWPLIDKPLESCTYSSCAGAVANASSSVWILPSMTCFPGTSLVSSCMLPWYRVTPYTSQ